MSLSPIWCMYDLRHYLSTSVPKKKVYLLTLSLFLFPGLTSSWNKYFNHAAAQQRKMEIVMNCQIFRLIVVCLNLIMQVCK